ncbi:MAG: class I SAM-dependent methyltransferase [Defluviitaleaceae bacterium]|nr:class I SAM-dependent methyltransferase [Defluviitaleaceae bacterium]
MRLSSRLQAIADMVRHDSLVDIGADHGYLPIFLAKAGLISRGLATDIAVGPVARGLANVAAHGVADIVKVRQGAGLDGVNPDFYATCTITGMGGIEICDILHKNLPIARFFAQLILSPQRDIPMVRRFLHNNGFFITNELMIIDTDKYYNILDCVPGEPLAYSEHEYAFGRQLIAKKCKIFGQFLQGEYKKSEKNIRNIDKNNGRYMEIFQYMEMIREVQNELDDSGCDSRNGGAGPA